VLQGTIIDEILKKAGNVDIYVVSAARAEELTRHGQPTDTQLSWREYGLAGLIVVLCGAIGWVAHAFGLAEANVIMILLAGVALVATRLGRGPAIAAAIVSVLVYDIFFVPPYMTLAVSDTEYIITFAVMLGIGLLISGLASRQRSQLHMSQQQERRTGQLFRMTRQLSELSGTEFLVRTAGKQLQEIFAGDVVIFVAEDNGPLALRYGEETAVAQTKVNHDVARWVAENGRLAGAQTDTLPNATALFVPLTGSRGIAGAIGVAPRNVTRFLDPDQIRLLETCGSLIALSLERDESVLEAHAAQLQMETEKLRNSLLSAVSHDLRTPLASIAGASSTLATAENSLPAETRAALLESISDEAERLTRLVENLLHMTRLSSNKVEIRREWHPVDEIIGSALTRMERQLAGRRIETHIADNLPLIKVDSILIEQLLVNLVDNAIKYSSEDLIVEVSARLNNKQIELEVADRGRGFAQGDESRVFDLFYRGDGAPADQRGTGIGLAICRAIAEVHGGTMNAYNRPGGGAIVGLSLPNTEAQPEFADRGGGSAGS
jgi:two-component system, OmpR family, sensor histidine kinase KdpD